ncbi:MAG: hypothetical protein VYC34_02330, partial [Planctomycetota bacterium]|nr:hypothetical protein [Planctomycetota bacterium]
ASLNGSYSWLGPKHEVNATTGFYPYPYTGFPNNSPIGKRLQVLDTDLIIGGGRRYFVEGHYVANDDAAAGNDDNNASYREVTVASGSKSLNVDFFVPTVRRATGIDAWATIDNAVTLQTQHDPEGGFWKVAHKVTDLGGGQWQYEYAVYNMNSDRSGQAVDVEIGQNANISNVGFRDVDWHSGAPYDNTDWNSSVGANSVSWAGATFAQNQNANAIRWGTMYNFRFIADTAPTSGDLTLSLFKPGTGSALSFPVDVPAAGVVPCPWDLSGDGEVNAADLGALLGSWNNPYTAQDLGALLGSWGPCP